MKTQAFPFASAQLHSGVRKKHKINFLILQTQKFLIKLPEINGTKLTSTPAQVRNGISMGVIDCTVGIWMPLVKSESNLSVFLVN